MSAKEIQVTKRAHDGTARLEPINLDKIHKVLAWAAEGLDVSVSEVEINARIQFYDGIKTEDIHAMIIKSAADLISVEEPDYQFLAARLLMFHVRKIAYGDFAAPRLYDHVKRLVGMGLYDKELMTKYSEEDFDEMDKFVDHNNDLKLAYAAASQMEKKLLVQNRVSRQVFESPQMLYVLSGACLFQDEPKEIRLGLVRKYYEAEANFHLSWPTPIRNGVRTPTRQFSSCVKIDCGDSLDSIKQTSNAIIDYASLRAGIGINGGRLRAMGSPVRNGEARHTGLIPFYRLFESSIKSCSQGGVRAGSATLFYPMWHLDVESLLVLKNNKGTYDNRVRRIDYAVQINGLMYERLCEESHITLFSPDEVPGLYQAFFADQAEFRRLYTKYENTAGIRKVQVPARDIFFKMMLERANTGRIYIMNVDNVNEHSAFNAATSTIYQSNLCMEILEPTRPLETPSKAEPFELPKGYENDKKLLEQYEARREAGGEIALCTLGAFNLGKINTIEQFMELAPVQVRALDNLLDYQDYPVEAARNGTHGRRQLGIGIINLAYLLAKNDCRYSDGSGLNLVHRVFEAMQYALLDASCELAKERGPCELFNQTTYAQGLLPIDTYNKNVDDICDEPLHLDWEALRAKIKKYGLRNSTLTALMPSETSSQIANATNGIEPPRGLRVIKGSKDGVPPVLVPEVQELGGKYELCWQMGTNRGYIELVAVMQKFVDQAISANTYYDPNMFADGKVPMEILCEDLLYAYSLGVKTLYYHNTPKDEDAEACGSGGCSI